MNPCNRARVADPTGGGYLGTSPTLSGGFRPVDIAAPQGTSGDRIRIRVGAGQARAGRYERPDAMIVFTATFSW